jgi:hypothetical protein
MTTFEYLAVLISIIVGLGITHLLGGVARFIHHPGRFKFYWAHFLWTVTTFMTLILFWWIQLWMNSVEEWNSYLYAFLVLYSVLLYLQCVIITPPDSPEGLDLRQYFFSKRKWFFGVVLAGCLMDVVDGLIKEHDTGYQFVFVPLVVVALLTKNPKYHAFLAIIFFLVPTLTLLLGGWDTIDFR